MDDRGPDIGLKQALEAVREHPAWKNRESSDRRKARSRPGDWRMARRGGTSYCRLPARCRRNLHDCPWYSGSYGSNTAFAQIAAEALDLSLDKVFVTTGDTSSAPYAGGTGGSKITYTVGPAVLKAAEEARQQVLTIASDHLEAAVEDLEIADGLVQGQGGSGRIDFTQTACDHEHAGGRQIRAGLRQGIDRDHRHRARIRRPSGRGRRRPGNRAG